MAKKAKSLPKSSQTTATSPATRHAGMVPAEDPTQIQYFFKSLLLAVVLSFASLATHLALRPLYGSIPTSINHGKVKTFGCFVSILLPFESGGMSDQSAFIALATLLAYAPYATYGIGVWSAKWKNAVMGATAAEVAVLLPVLVIGVGLLRRWNAKSLTLLPGPWSATAFVAIGSLSFLNITESWLRGHLPLGGNITSTTIFLTVAGGLTTCSVLLFTPVVPSKIHSDSKSKTSLSPSSRASYLRFLPLCLPLIAGLSAISQPPSYSPPLPYTRGSGSSLASKVSTTPGTVRVLARTYSVTGLVLVGEHVEEKFRFLRVDHSLLGGRWILDKIAPGTRDNIGDSIYSTFVLQEAVRLAKIEAEKATKERALFVGLGVGVAPESFISQGINTTVVEIDPAVYKYAREHFSLPKPQAVYLEDAREWVHEHAPLAVDERYDYVVHDCFSGGGVPEHMFTFEFWEELKGVVKTDGIIAVNFAGRLASDPARAVFLTLQKSFGRCRAFHDHFEAEFDDSYSLFNIVFFCTPFSQTPPIFRNATTSDFRGSYLRRHILSGFARREIEPSRLLGLDKEPELLADGDEKWIVRDKSNRLSEWDAADAVEHWGVMRQVIPDVFWETY